jgi:LPS-assembly lipoprotein
MRRLIVTASLLTSLLLVGCTGMRPLYGSGPDGRGVAVALSNVTVDEQRTRAGQIVRNNLISSFGNAGSSAYVLRLTPTEATKQVSAYASQKLQRKRYNLKVKYELADSQSGATVSEGTSFSNVSFDTVEQPIADLRAAENARDRAGREVAEDIRLRLAAYFSSK